MSLIVIHGEQTHLSRQKLVELLQKAKQEGKEVQTLNAKQLSPSDLETHLGSTSLFGSQSVLVIEELHSLPVSARRKSLLEMVAKAETEILLWEKRSLTKTMLKTLNPSQDFEFKPTSNLFKWLDALSPNPKTKNRQLQLLASAVEGDGADLCFIMLIRQVRLLIQAKTNAKIAGAPFIVSKLKTQAQAFTLAQLLRLHTKLLEIDLQYKTSKLSLTLAKELDLLLVRL